MKAMLPSTTDNPEKYLSDPKWGMQEKMDGERCLVDVGAHGIDFYSRTGNKIRRNILQDVKFLRPCKLDGERIGFDYYVFDVIDNADLPAKQRCNLLTIPNHYWIDNLHIHVVPTYWTETDKIRKFDNFRWGGHVEGVVFKQMNRAYVSGQNSHTKKYKFRKSIDCVVIGLGETKSNLELGVFDAQGVLTPIGKTSALTGDGAYIKPGDVVEVSYQRLTQNNRLYNVTMPRIRTDKPAKDCTMEQL
jgi:ATP-dependent DNA ligase